MKKLLLILLSSALLLALASPANAMTVTPEEETTTTTSIVTLTPDYDAAQLNARYASLSSALMGYYAEQSGLSLSAYLSANQAQVTALFGSEVKLDSTTALPDNMNELNAKINQAKSSVSSNNFKSLEDMTKALATNPQSFDFKALASSADFASKVANANRSLGTLKTPSLTTPTASMPSPSELPKMSSESLAFGLFADKTLTALVTDYPDMFAQVKSSGLSTPEAQTAWNSSMKTAFASSQSDIKSGLFTDCHSAMISAMVGVKPLGNTSGCGSCALAGTYMSHQFGSLLDPKEGNLFGSGTETDWSKLSAPVTNAEVKPQDLRTQLLQEENAAAKSAATNKDCKSSSTAIQEGFSGALPNILNMLK